MLQHANIVCFAGKDWEDDPTSNDHVMRRLARHNQALWLDSIGMRTPRWGTRRDIRKAIRKLLNITRGTRHAGGDLLVSTPFLLPFPHNRHATAINRRILPRALARLRRRLPAGPFQLWTFTPTVEPYVDALGASLVIYYCTDEWSQFQHGEPAAVEAMEQRLCRRADLVLVTADALLHPRRAINPETHLVRHGVDHALFATALSDSVDVAPEIRPLNHPVLGFVGKIEHWVDLDLIADLASRRPDASIVLVGEPSVDTSSLARLPNVHLLGRKPYTELPRYLKGFDAGLIPFRLNELTRSVNPIKLREYLSAGLPVVSTPLPEVARYNGLSTFVATGPEFTAAVERALSTDSAEARMQRSRAMEAETWDTRIEEVSAHVERVAARPR